jgi:hypothetical protein
LSGIYLVKDGDQILCTVRLDQAKRLRIPLPPCFPEIGDRDDGEDSDAGSTRKPSKLTKQSPPSCDIFFSPHRCFFSHQGSSSVIYLCDSRSKSQTWLNSCEKSVLSEPDIVFEPWLSFCTDFNMLKYVSTFVCFRSVTISIIY